MRQITENKILTYFADSPAAQCKIIPLESWTYNELADFAGMSAGEIQRFSGEQEVSVFSGGWQSWSCGWELAGNETLPSKVFLMPVLRKLTARELETPREGEIIAHFITYLRAGDSYLCLASRAAADLPPVDFRIDRKNRRVTAEVFCPGKHWEPGELLAEIYVCACTGYFALKDAIKRIYKQDFSCLDFLRSTWKNGIPGGYESWYNHYTNINEGLILEDLYGISQNENLIKRMFINKEAPVVFQIDDGWETCVGQWDVNEKRFPGGLVPLAEKIEGKGFIPGLWVAPFLVTRKSRVFKEKRDWLLRDKTGKPVVAGFNPQWDGYYYCLDISRKDTLEYLAQLIGAIIGWGFRYLKLDFLYAGFLLGSFAETGSVFEHYERACAALTRCRATPSGLPVAYLGCGAPLGPSVRHFPLMRTGADTREEWDWNAIKLLGHAGRPSAYINLLDTIGRSFMDNTIFCSDPDVVFTRTQNCKLKPQEKELIALVNFLLAGQIMFSDDPARLSLEDLRFTGRIISLYEKLSGDEYGAVRLARDVFRLLSRSGRTSGIINLSAKPYAANEFGDWDFLVDHRTGGGFAPHTISIAQRA